MQTMSYMMESTAKRQADGWAPIHVAAAFGHESVVGVLLEQSAFVDFQTANGGQTPLFLAAQNGHVGVCSQLLDRGADAELATKTDGWTPMIAACAGGKTAIVRLLKARSHARLDVLTNDGETPLYLAAAGNHREVIKELLEGISPVDVSTRAAFLPSRRFSRLACMQATRVSTSLISASRSYSSFGCGVTAGSQQEH
jgi:ankyrin repeat protein